MGLRFGPCRHLARRRRRISSGYPGQGDARQVDATGENFMRGIPVSDAQVNRPVGWQRAHHPATRWRYLGATGTSLLAAHSISPHALSSIRIGVLRTAPPGSRWNRQGSFLSANRTPVEYSGSWRAWSTTQPEYRPLPWSRAGWYDEVLAWADRSLAATGSHRVGPYQQLTSRSRGTVLRADASRLGTHLKPPHFRHAALDLDDRGR